MTSDIENLKTFDPFSEADQDELGITKEKKYIHIRLQQRNGRKTLTTIQGLPTDLVFKKLVRTFKKDFCCNGTIIEDPKLGKIIQLQGDQRTNVADFLVKEDICKKSEVKIHGF